jgi:hypothetical protein
MTAYGTTIRDNVFTFKDERLLKTTDGLQKYSNIGTPLAETFPMVLAPGTVRVSSMVYASLPGIVGVDSESYVWRLEAVYEFRWVSFGAQWHLIGTPTATLIAGPTSPVCDAYLASSSQSIRIYYKGETGKTFKWRVATEFTFFRRVGLGTGGPPPRITLQISSGMTVGETWNGLTEGIHTLLPTEFNQTGPNNPNQYYKYERWYFYGDDSLVFKAVRYGVYTTSIWYSSNYAFYWGDRSTGADGFVTSVPGGVPPTYLNGFLRDNFLDNAVVIGSGETEVTFTWERKSGDATEMWANY